MKIGCCAAALCGCPGKGGLLSGQYPLKSKNLYEPVLYVLCVKTYKVGKISVKFKKKVTLNI